MAFVREKEVKGIPYYYLVKSERKEGKVKQKTIKYLGRERPSKEEIKTLKRKHEREK